MMAITYRGTETQIVAGLRVVRGPNWKWGNQDAGEGYVGTVVEFKKNKLTRLSDLLDFSEPSGLSGLLEDSKGLGIVSVIWDCGIKNDYRIGHESAFDLRVVDNSATGVKHIYTSCIQCCADSDIIGIRWHCEECNGSICSSCFFQDKHDTTHTKFKRYDTPNVDPVDVVLDPTKHNVRIELKGMFQGARVKRGPDWKNGDEDVADDVTGVGWVMESRNQAPGMVQVKWQNGQTYPYRLGSDGKVDLQLVKIASGGFYHPEHLPVLKSSFMNSVTNSDGEVKLAVGDRVQIFIGDEEELKKLQDGHGGYVSGIKKYIKKPGTVRSLNEVGVIVVYEDGMFFNLNPEILLRLSPFSKDQPVRIKDDEFTISFMANKFGTVAARKKLAGETGRVVSSSEENDYIEVILDSDKKNEIQHLHRAWVEILRGDPKVTKAMAKLKSKMISAFVQAAASGQLNTVKEILTKYPINIDAKNDDGETAMHSACRNGHLEIIKNLYFLAKEKGLSTLEQQDGDGKRPIHHATEGCHWKVLKFLIKPEDDPNSKGANLNVKDNKGLTPLQIAIRAGCLQSAQLLIENGSDVNSQDSDGDTALHNAIIIEKQYYRDPQIISALMSSNNINLKLQNKRGLNPLMLSVAVKNRVAFNDLLKVGRKELVNEVENESKFTAIHLVCYKGELQFARDLLKHLKGTFENKDIKNYVEKRCKNGFTPLLLSVVEGHYALVELLVEKFEANVKVKDDDGDNPVHLAAMKLDKLTDEPNPKTSPAIFKIHSELKAQHNATITSYPGLSLMCYLISKGCPWRKTRNGKAKAVINNDLIRVVLETCKQPEEEPMEIEEVKTDGGCLFCPSTTTIVKEIKECGHTTSIACLECFQNRLYKCPTCHRLLKTSSNTSNDFSVNPFEEGRPDTILTPRTSYLKQYLISDSSLNVAGQNGTTPVQESSPQQYGYPDPGPSTSGYQASSNQQENNQFCPPHYSNQQQNPHVRSYEPSHSNMVYSHSYQSLIYDPNLAFNNGRSASSNQAPQYNDDQRIQPPAVHQPQWNERWNSELISQLNSYQNGDYNIPKYNLDGSNNWREYLTYMSTVTTPMVGSGLQSENWNGRTVTNPEPLTQGVSTGNLEISSQPMTHILSNDHANNSDILSAACSLISSHENHSESSTSSTPLTAAPSSGTLNSNDQTEQQTTSTNENSVTLTTTTAPSKNIGCERIENGSKKGGPILKYDGNIYSVQRGATGTWQCIKAKNDKRSKCPATIIEEKNGMYRLGPHKHDHYKKPEGHAKKRRIEQPENGSGDSSVSTQKT